MAMVDVDGSSLPTDSQPEMNDWVSALAVSLLVLSLRSS